MNATRQLQALGLILIAALAMDMWALAVDQAWTAADNHVHRAINLLYMPADRWLAFLLAQSPKGPVLPALVAPLLWLVGDAAVGGRLLGVLCHGLIIALAFRLAARLLPGRAAGPWAALLCAVTPMIFGWCRLEYGEPVLACLLLLAVDLMAAPVRSAPRAAALGAVVAAGLLTKPGFAVYLLFPALFALPRQLTSLRRVGCLLLALAVSAGAVVPWAVINLEALQQNFGMSGGGGDGTGALLRLKQIISLPGAAPLLLAAPASLWLLHRRRELSRLQLLYYLGAVLAPVVMFTFWFHLWSRYLMPALALAGPGLALLLDRLAPRSRRLAAGALAGALALTGLYFNLASTGDGRPRELNSGMLSPDRRPHTGLRGAADLIWRRGGRKVLLAYDSSVAMDRIEGLDALLRFRGTPLGELDARRARASLGEGRSAWALLMSIIPLAELERAGLPELHEGHAADPSFMRMRRDTEWLMRHPRREVLYTQADPDGMHYQVLLLRPAATPEGKP